MLFDNIFTYIAWLLKRETVIFAWRRTALTHFLCEHRLYSA